MFAINLALAAFLGYLVDGPFGIGMAMLLAALVLGALACWRDPATWFGTLWSALLVISLPLTICSAIIAVVVIRIGALLDVSSPGRRAEALTPFGRGLRLIQSLVAPRVLWWTVANVMLLMVVGSAIGGTEVALFLALLAVPVTLVGWAILSREPDEPVS